jgi:hypothetical protein
MVQEIGEGPGHPCLGGYPDPTEKTINICVLGVSCEAEEQVEAQEAGFLSPLCH